MCPMHVAHRGPPLLNSDKKKKSLEESRRTFFVLYSLNKAEFICVHGWISEYLLFL